MKQFILIFILSVLTTKIAFSTDLDNSLKESKTINFIKDTLKPGKYYNIKAGILKKILVATWSTTPPETIRFNENGTFDVFNWDAVKQRISYSGQWDTEDNTLLFKMEGMKEWGRCKIKEIEYWACTRDCEKESFRNQLAIIFEKNYYKAKKRTGIFLDSIGISFN